MVLQKVFSLVLEFESHRSQTDIEISNTILTSVVPLAFLYSYVCCYNQYVRTYICDWTWENRP